MSRTFRVSGVVTLCLDLTAEFEDDGETDLMGQAYDALSEHDDIPLCMAREIESIHIEQVWEI